MRRVVSFSVALVIAGALLAGCGDNKGGSSGTTTITAKTTTSTGGDTTSTSSPTQPGHFLFTIPGLDIEGEADSCDVVTPQAVTVTFKGETAQVAVDAANDTGTVKVTGATQFDGTVASVLVASSGKFVITGQGTNSSPGATSSAPTGFVVTGVCP